MKRNGLRVLLLFLPIAALSACGGGAGSEAPPGRGIEGSGSPNGITSAGAITGKGSIFVNDVEYDLAGASIAIDGDIATEADLDVGDIVIVEGELGANPTTGKATRVTAGIAVAGPISAVDLALEQVTILGQAVVIDAKTRVVEGDDAQPLGGLEAGDDVEVTGFADSTGTLLALRIAPRKASTPLRVTGYAAGVDRTNHRFVINGQTIDYTSATLTGLSESGLPGAPVRVDADDADAQGALLATDVIYRDPRLPGDAGDMAVLQGWVTRFATESDFDVDGHPVVTTPNTRVEGATDENLGHVRLDAFVSVEGRLIGGGVVEAALVEINNVVALDTVITRIDSTSKSVDAALVPWAGPGCAVEPETAITIDGRPAELGALAIGDVANIHARVFGDIGQGTHGATCGIIAVQHNVRGPLESKPTASASFMVMGQRVWFDSANTDQGFVALDGLEVGDLVEVSGHTAANGDILATAVHDAAAGGGYQVIGLAQAVDILASRFALGDLVIDYAGAEVGGFPNEAPSERDRVLVTATAAPSSGVLHADLVRYTGDIPRGSTMNFVNPVGLITRYASPEDLDVEGRRLIRLPNQVGASSTDPNDSVWTAAYCDVDKLHPDLRASFYSVGGIYGRPLYWTAQCPWGRAREQFGPNFGGEAPLELHGAVESIDLVNRSVRVAGVDVMLHPAVLLSRLVPPYLGDYATTTPAHLEDFAVGERAWVKVRGNPADGIRTVDAMWVGDETEGETLSAELQSVADPELILFGGVRVRVTAATQLPSDCAGAPYDVAQFFAHAALGRRVTVAIVRNGDELVAESIHGAAPDCPLPVDAGPDQIVVAGTLVRLAGTYDTACCSTFSMYWSQKAGPTVDLHQDHGIGWSAASFTAPTVPESIDLVFEFSVATDEGFGPSGSDTVTIRVSPRP